MTIERLPFEHRPRNSIANNLDKINELVDWVNLDTHLYASASGERVTVDDASSVKGLTVDGRGVQDGTPTPDAPVPVQMVEGPLSLVIGDTSVAINLQGNTLASLPDGTRDELHVDSAGRVTIDSSLHVWNMRDYADNANWKRSSSAINGYYLSMQNINPRPMTVSSGASVSGMLCNIALAQNTVNGYYNRLNSCIIDSNFNFNLNPAVVGSTLEDFKTWLSTHDVYVVAKLATPQTFDLGYIDPPAIPSGSVVTVSASLTPEITLEWWVDDGITALVDDLIAYIDYKTEG